MGANDTMATVRAAAHAAIEQQCFGEDFGYDTTLVVAPTPTGGAMIIYTLVVTMRSPLLGQGPLTMVVQINSPAPTAEQVEQAVTQAMSSLREASAKLLATPAGPVGSPLL